MARTDDDTWDLASSVGATATMVAAQRALANRGGPDRRPVRRAAGAGGRNGLLHPGARRRDRLRGRRSRVQPAARRRGHGGAHPLLRQVVHRCRGRRCPPGGDPRRRPRRARLPAAVAGRNDRVRGRPAGGHRVQDHDAEPGSAPKPRPTGAPIAIDLRDDWPKALLDNGFDPHTAHRVDRRGPADLPAARGPGHAVRQHHRAQRSRQPVGHRAHPGYVACSPTSGRDASPNG